ncbi:hypothetical protein [Clostridium sp.]|uniref:hypothetical protein n=1 Tax=Clostridium sp. TaxID=1506 RepID=UPI002A909807|nr:hypothetical protein [Clostridium sp.]MDY6012668.1 hypothetical protein [Clostridium sp.]
MRRKNSKNYIILTSLIFIVLFLIYIFCIINKPITEVNSPTIINSDANIDLTGDGIPENIKIINNKNHSDLQITTFKKTILLSSLTSDNYISDYSNSYNMNVLILNISRDNKPEILIQGYKKNSPITYLFTYEQNKFVLKYSSKTPIVGLIDSNMNRTPQLYLLNGINTKKSFKNFMLINDELIDITKNSKIIADYDKILSFINIVSLDYEITDYPDIFHKYIEESNISVLYKLDKDNFKYSFKDGFFYDNEVDSDGILQNIRWNVTFEKTNKASLKKEEIIFELDLSREDSKNFKISNICLK